MNVVIDWGNTHCKWAIFKNSTLLYTHTEPAGNLQGLKDHMVANTVEYALLASVINTPAEELYFLRHNFSLLELSIDTKIPIVNLYKTPKTLGNDRLAAAVGSQFLFPAKNVLAIDAGTCIKFDFVNAEGAYLGGSIAPGINMRFKALHDYTNKLPLVEPQSTAELIGNTTQNSILSGILNGCIAEIDGMIDAYQKQHKDIVVVLTGGDAIYFDKKLKNSIFAAPHLVFVGLNEILRCNV